MLLRRYTTTSCTSPRRAKNTRRIESMLWRWGAVGRVVMRAVAVVVWRTLRVGVVTLLEQPPTTMIHHHHNHNYNHHHNHPHHQLQRVVLQMTRRHRTERPDTGSITDGGYLVNEIIHPSKIHLTTIVKIGNMRQCQPLTILRQCQVLTIPVG